MDRICTIWDWWDGPLEGVAEFRGDLCVYQRIFDTDRDDWEGRGYWITPLCEKLTIDELEVKWSAFISRAADETGDQWYTFCTNNSAPVYAPEGYHKYTAQAYFRFPAGLKFTADIMNSKDITVEWKDIKTI